MPGGAVTNCGVPSFDRNQSSTLARIRTGAVPWLVSVMACVWLSPGAPVSSTRRGETSTETCADAQTGSRQTMAAQAPSFRAR